MFNIFVVFLITYGSQCFQLFKPSFVERNKIEVSFTQKMSYHRGKEINYYISEGIEIVEKSIKFNHPGRIVFNVPMVEGLDYAIQFQFEGLNANHIACVGIGGQGFILSEVLGIEVSELSHYQLGYCSDGTNSTKYPDTYTDYYEFQEEVDEDLDEIQYNYGESEATNKFGNDYFYMVLRDNQLIFMDHEKYTLLYEISNIMMTYNDLDRARTYIPIITMHYRNQVKQKIIKKKKCVIVEEFAFVQLVAQFNPFKKEMSKELKQEKQEQQKQKEQEKQTEIAKMLKEKQEADPDYINEEELDQAENDQLNEQLRTQETKELHKQIEEQVPDSEQQAEEEIPSEEMIKTDDLGESEESTEISDSKEQDQDQDQAKTSKDDISLLKDKEDQGEEEEQEVESETDQKKRLEEEKMKQPEDDETETKLEIMSVQSHIIKQQLFTKAIIPLRTSMVIEDEFTIYQDNQRLGKVLQEYKSCSYAYLDVKPPRGNFYMSVVIQNLDDLYNPYPIGVGVYAYQMIDRLKGWRNLQDQLWCLDKESEDLWQYGALYRSDGTFIDSYMFGEYFKYKVDKEAMRSTKIKIYFSDKNRVAFTFDDEKSMILTCVNPKFKYYVPIFELKAYKGVPSITMEEYVQDVEIPFKYSDNDDAIYSNFYEQTFPVLENYYVEKRNSFNEDDDDYTLSGNGGKSASINMWETRLYEEPQEWWVRIDELHDDKNQIQMCIGINQMSSEQIMEQILFKNYKPQVAYLCDKNDFIHTFFQECPINENKITFIKGTILRLRISNYLLEMHDGYNTVYFSLRSLGRTGVVPSAVIIGHPSNKLTFLNAPLKYFGPNPFETRVDVEQFEAEIFKSYDIFTLPILENAKNGLFKPNSNEPLFKSEKISSLVKDKKEQPIGQIHKLKEQEKQAKLEEEQQKSAADNKDAEQTKQSDQSEQDSKQKLTVSKVPSEIESTITGSLKLKCIIVYEHCNFEGPNKELYPNKIDTSPPQLFRSLELCKDTTEIKIIIDGHVQEQMIITDEIQCLPSPLYISDIRLM